jgi:hypothetical protein
MTCKKRSRKILQWADKVKVLYIRGVERLMRDLNANWRYKKFVPTYLPEILVSYEKCMELDIKKVSIEKLYRSASI